jgi:hypothetical protein
MTGRLARNAREGDGGQAAANWHRGAAQDYLGHLERGELAEARQFLHRLQYDPPAGTDPWQLAEQIADVALQRRMDRPCTDMTAEGR